ncbi:competence type IV pilus ATPase ComGA [Streptococcus sp. CSL10205-OR2]|uniref:competence type IV pilus ATPase ComGA n=1 Tax=Streptococcus sp. CSL10205-OR2 TaxID=2980558 RepID=UPI0021DB582F|nr:competence type IV pilus ATPase ComGA [Streptococcus sp. CSL10205-OR2]MCU9534012.1 competence type IV pilus ATPase ComGA [Streptococcus sp. CSL10205-OR2]
MIQEIGKNIIKQAVEKQAQDIYLIPKSNQYELYMRIKDDRKWIASYPYEEMAGLISHFKFVSGMNVGEKRRSQLGACDYLYDNEKAISLRLSSVSDYKGFESLVIRLLFDNQESLAFWFDGDKKMFQEQYVRGLYLFSGPVGSGKTTLMYHLIREKFPDKQIMTIEDPVEMKQENMLQLQINNSIEMTYERLIKLSLRHRPDVLIIGEIRDTETARAVIRASLTGVIIFSTLHAKSIPGVYHRLLELGITKKELANTLNGVAYQRLIAGGALIDFAKENYQNYSQNQWNKQLKTLFTDGHITKEQKEAEEIIT